MLRVLTLSTLFPDAHRPNFGVFVEQQTLGLAARPDVALMVVSPVGLPPSPLRLHPHYRGRTALPLHENWKGLDVYRPRFLHVPGIGARLAPSSIARALLPMLRRLRETFAFDVIDAEFFWPDGPAAIALGRALGIPVSIKARGGDIHFWSQKGFARRQIVKAGRNAAGMLAVSAALKRDMVALGFPQEKIRVHYTGVDLDRFVPADRILAKAALGVEGPLLLSVGYLIERKGQALVIEAMRALPEAILLIVGEGPALPALKTQIAAAGLGDRVQLLGSRPHDELPALFAAADVMVLPSASEGLANVWVEALACGTPIVIADVGGARELIDRPAAGRIVDRTPTAITEAVHAILAAPPPRVATRAAAERFTWSANTTTLYEHLSALITAPVSPRG